VTDISAAVLCSADIGSGTNRPRFGSIAELQHHRGVTAPPRIVLRQLADLTGLVMSSATSLTRHRIGGRLGVRAGSVLGGLHHEHLTAPASA
jgi:hypothetical protein